MPTFILSLNWTDQGVKSVKDVPKRIQGTRELAKKIGADIKDVYLTSGTGEYDVIQVIVAPHVESVAKLALSIRAHGHVQTRISKAWSEQEFKEMLADVP